MLFSSINLNVISIHAEEDDNMTINIDEVNEELIEEQLPQLTDDDQVEFNDELDQNLPGEISSNIEEIELPNVDPVIESSEQEVEEEMMNDSSVVEKSTIWVVGDSTVSSFNDEYYYPRYGWGTQLDKYFDQERFEIKNIALSGRSSKSYITEPEYQMLVNGMKEGDYLFIGFGHNDEKTEVDRYTNPNGDYNSEGSFAQALYTHYIKPALDNKATPVLMTPIVRRSATGNWTSSELHVTTSSGQFEGGDYPQAIRRLGSDLNVAVVDLTTLTTDLYDGLGSSETLNLHAWTSHKEASVDNTHTNIWGAHYNAYFIAKTVKELTIDGLSEYVIESAITSVPTKEQYLQPNPNYVISDYNPNLEDSELWDDYGIWKGTVFGDIGGATNITSENFVLGTDEDGNMNIAVKNNRGKIAASVDGLAMYYYKVPVGSTFTLTATARINDFALNDQVSFGLMARDEMYVDEYKTGVLGDYVAAAPLKLTKTGQVWNSFARKSGVLTQGGTMVNEMTKGDTVELKLESNSDGYATTIGNEQTITGGFDFPLTAIDSEYVYMECLFQEMLMSHLVILN